MVRRKESKKKSLSEQEEQEHFTFGENSEGIAAELWIGPIELESALGVMHVSRR